MEVVQLALRRIDGAVRAARHLARGEQGLSLIETLIAAALLLMLSVSILPLFFHASWSNVKGSDGSELANFSRGGLEELWQRNRDDITFDMSQANVTDLETVPASIPDIGGTAQGQLVLSQEIWRRNAKTPVAQEVKVNEGDWIPVNAPYKSQGIVFNSVDDCDDSELTEHDLFRRKMVMRQYAYSNISDGVISADGGGAVITEGDPHLFDRALGAGADKSSRHLKEFEVEIESCRQGELTPQRLRLQRLF